MTRKFLEDKGLSKELIDEILDENSKDIGKAKGELETVKSQLKTAQKDNEGFIMSEISASKVRYLNKSNINKDEKGIMNKIQNLESFALCNFNFENILVSSKIKI